MQEILILLDSSAILNDESFSFDPKKNYVMTSRIVGEMKDLRSRMMVDNATILNLLSIQDACPISIEKMQSFIASKGFDKLSQADISILALAKELIDSNKKIVLLSDDYSIQNMCKELGIPFKSVIQGKIKQTISFEKHCSACGKSYPPSHSNKICDICGGTLKSRKRVKMHKKAKTDQNS